MYFHTTGRIKSRIKMGNDYYEGKGKKKKMTLYTSRNKFSSLTQHLEPNTMSPLIISILLYPSCTKTLAQSITEMEF